MRNSKIIIALAIFFCTDLLRPFGYVLNVEFLFCGIIFMAMNYRLSLSIPSAFIFGYAKDIFLATSYSITIIEFILLCIGINYIMHFFILSHKHTKIVAKSVVVLLALTLHILLNTAQSNFFSPWYVFQFFIHTAIIYFLSDYLLERWIIQRPAVHFR